MKTCIVCANLCEENCSHIDCPNLTKTLLEEADDKKDGPQQRILDQVQGQNIKAIHS